MFDGGVLEVADPARFQLKREDVAETNLSVACFLVVHAKGVLLWDACSVSDSEWTPTGAPVKHHIVLPDKQERDVTIVKPLKAQLADAGYSPADITHLALSHYHYDHTANANDYARATWLVQRAERDAMFADPPPGVTRPSTYAALRTSNTVIIEGGEHDVFGDGTVILKSTPGHTPGHQVLYVRLAKAGDVVLSGDLYHYPEEITYKKIPPFDSDKDQTAKSRAMIEEFVKKNHAQLWIQHDYTSGIKRKIAPEFYE